MKNVLLAIVTMMLLFSCTKEKPSNNVNPVVNDSIGTTSYFRFTDSSHGDYGNCVIEPYASGNINVVIHSVKNVNNSLKFYNMPQASIGIFPVKNYFNGVPNGLNLWVEGWIDNRQWLSEGGTVTKTSAFSFTFNIPMFGVTPHYITGWGSY